MDDVAIFLDSGYIFKHLSLDGVLASGVSHFVVPGVLEEITRFSRICKQDIAATEEKERTRAQAAGSRAQSEAHLSVSSLVRYHEEQSGLAHDPHIVTMIREGLERPYVLELRSGTSGNRKGSRMAMKGHFDALVSHYGAVAEALGVRIESTLKGMVVSPIGRQERVGHQHRIPAYRMADLRRFRDAEDALGRLLERIDALDQQAVQAHRAGMFAKYLSANRRAILRAETLPEVADLAQLSAKSLLHHTYKVAARGRPLKELDPPRFMGSFKRMLEARLEARGYALKRNDPLVEQIVCEGGRLLRTLARTGREVAENGIATDANLVSAAYVLRREMPSYRHVEVRTCDRDVATIVELYNAIHADRSTRIACKYLPP